jgi:iron-sulfur cluster assembly accessory protein
MTVAEAPATPVVVTARAAKRIMRVVAQEAPGTALRVSVSGGGCSGFQYHFDLTTERGEDDIVIEKDGAVVLVDAMSLDYMGGSEIDYVDTLIGASFQIRNPHATASCGCGTSFSV